MPVVRKGAGRPAAAAKRKKHAQRTPLPPKQEPQEEVQPAKNGKRASRWVAPRADVKTKAEDFANYAREHGWWASDVDVDGAMVRITCKRVNDDEKEAIYIEWDNGRIRPGSVQFHFVDLDRRVTLRNVSAARLVINGTQVVKREIKARAKRQAGPRSVLRVDDEGRIARVEVDPGEKVELIGAHIIDKCYHLKAGTPGQGKKKGKLFAKVAHIGAQQRDGLRRVFEADGLTVIVDECTIHGQKKDA